MFALQQSIVIKHTLLKKSSPESRTLSESIDHDDGPTRHDMSRALTTSSLSETLAFQNGFQTVHQKIVAMEQ